MHVWSPKRIVWPLFIFIFTVNSGRIKMYTFYHSLRHQVNQTGWSNTLIKTHVEIIVRCQRFIFFYFFCLKLVSRMTQHSISLFFSIFQLLLSLGWLWHHRVMLITVNHHVQTWRPHYCFFFFSIPKHVDPLDKNCSNSRTFISIM